MSSSYKPNIETASPADIIDNATTDLQDLQNELQEWYDSMPPNLQEGEKGDSVQEAISAIESIVSDLSNIDQDTQYFYPDARITYTTQVKRRKAKQPSRQVRFDNIMAALTALNEFYASVDDEDDHNELIDTLDEAIQEVEIPGAWG
jgi:hypothetical protein